VVSPAASCSPPARTRTVGELAAAGCSVHEIPEGGPDQLYMHEKMLLTDRSNLIIGSHNLSTASLLENGELSLLLDTRTASTIIGAVETTFDIDYARTTS
jgi:cardiolipin synthase A/B